MCDCVDAMGSILDTSLELHFYPELTDPIRYVCNVAYLVSKVF